MTISPLILNNTFQEQMNTINELIDWINNGKLNFQSILNESLLPAPALADHNFYIIQNHTKIKGPALALLISGTWFFISLQLYVSHGKVQLNRTVSDFGVGVVVNKVVYKDETTTKWELANPNDVTKQGIAIVGPDNTLIFTGEYENDGLTLVPGVKYYYDITGSITSTITNGFIGIADTDHKLLIAGMGSGGSGSTSESMIHDFFMI